MDEESKTCVLEDLHHKTKVFFTLVNLESLRFLLLGLKPSSHVLALDGNKKSKFNSSYSVVVCFLLVFFLLSHPLIPLSFLINDGYQVHQGSISPVEGEEQTPTKSNVGEDFIFSITIQKVCCEHPIGIVSGDLAIRRRNF